MDMGPIVEGYNGDCMRTGFVGEPTPEFKELYRVNYEAMYAGIEQIRPGVHISEVDAAVRRTAESFGYMQNRFDTGHGIGLNCCELPVCMKAGSAPAHLDVVLEPGMCFTLEPRFHKMVGDGHVHPGGARGDGDGERRRRRDPHHDAVPRRVPRSDGLRGGLADDDRHEQVHPRRSAEPRAAADRHEGADPAAAARRRPERQAQLGAEGDRAHRPVPGRGDHDVGVRVRARGRPHVERDGRVQGRGGGPAPLRGGMAADSREVPRRGAEGVHLEERRAPVRARARDRRRRDRVAARAVEGGRAHPLEPRLHGPRPPDVARLGGLLRRARGRDHVLPRLGGVRARLPRRHQGRRRHAGVQDDRGPREAQPRLLGGDRVRGRGRRADRRTGSSRSSRPARTSTTWSTCTARRRRAR